MVRAGHTLTIQFNSMWILIMNYFFILIIIFFLDYILSCAIYCVFFCCLKFTNKIRHVPY